MSPSAEPPSPRRKSALQEIEVSPSIEGNIKMRRTESTTYENGEESHTVMELNESGHRVSMVTRSAEDDDSLALFDDSDFQRDTWTDVIYQRIDPPLLPLAVLAAAAAIFHPLIFIAGAASAATAVGAVHMIGHGYEMLFPSNDDDCMDASSASIQHAVGDTTTTSVPHSIRDAVLKPTTTTEETVHEDDDCEYANTYTDWLHLHFPPLSKQVVSQVQFEGLNALEFFNVFLGDDAPYTFQEFQKHRGDVDIEYGTWTAVDETPTPLSIHPNAIPLEVPPLNFTTYQRQLSFKTLNKSYFGPPFALVSKEQRIFVHKRLMILESRVELKDIPFCDRFFVIERWIVHSERETKLCTLSVTSQAFFTQECPFESQIRSKSTSTLKDVVSAWCEMAQKVLQLTMKHKLERERRQSLVGSENGSDYNSIEVQHSGDSGGGCIVLGDEENENVAPLDLVIVKPSGSSQQSSKRQALAGLKRSVLQRMATVRKSSNV